MPVDLRFAPGGILALFHDAMVTLGFFALTRKEVTISTVAASIKSRPVALPLSDGGQRYS